MSPRLLVAVLLLTVGTFRFFVPNLPVDFCLAVRLVRLAHKYQVARVLDDAMARIKTLYAGDFDAFIGVLNGRLDYLLSGHGNKDWEVIALSRLVGDTTLLRPAFYLPCQLVARDDLLRDWQANDAL